MPTMMDKAGKREEDMINKKRKPIWNALESARKHMYITQ